MNRMGMFGALVLLSTFGSAGYSRTIVVDPKNPISTGTATSVVFSNSNPACTVDAVCLPSGMSSLTVVPGYTPNSNNYSLVYSTGSNFAAYLWTSNVNAFNSNLSNSPANAVPFVAAVLSDTGCGNGGSFCVEYDYGSVQVASDGDTLPLSFISPSGPCVASLSEGSSAPLFSSPCSALNQKELDFSSNGTLINPPGATKAPEIDPRSAEAAITFLLGGLAVGLGRRRRAAIAV
jgi:hypothetical protein